MRTTTPNLAIAPPVGNDRMMEDIDSPEKLEAWLKDKPPSWATAIALRSAMRVIPTGLQAASASPELPRLASTLFRTVALSWIQCRYPEIDPVLVKDSIRSAVGEVGADSDIIARRPVVFSTFTSVRSIGVASYNSRGAVISVLRATEVGNPAEIWRTTSVDCADLVSANGGLAQGLVAIKLWPDDMPDWFEQDWKSVSESVSNSDSLAELWVDWFDRRIAGEETGFDLPTSLDAELSRRLIQEGNDWWMRPSPLISIELGEWIHRLRGLADQENSNDFAAIKARIDAGATPHFGSDEERSLRAELQRQIAALNEQLKSIDQPPAPIGHNRPPLDLEVADVEDAPAVLQETRILIDSLATEIVPEKPDIVATLDTLSRLQSTKNWLAKIGNLYAEEAAKSMGKRTGDAIMLGMLGLLLPTLVKLLMSAWHWLQIVLPLP
jgi:hypothetical protein